MRLTITKKAKDKSARTEILQVTRKLRYPILKCVQTKALRLRLRLIVTILRSAFKEMTQLVNFEWKNMFSLIKWLSNFLNSMYYASIHLINVVRNCSIDFSNLSPFLVAFWKVPFPHIYCWSALVIWRTWLVSLSNIWQPTSCSTPLPKLAPSSTLWTSLTATKSRTLDSCTFVVSLDVADLDLIGKWDLSWGETWFLLFQMTSDSSRKNVPKYFH